MASILRGVSPVEGVVAIALALYIFSSVRTPSGMAAMVDTSAGALAVIVVAIAVFLNTSAVVGVLALVAGYELLRRSRRGGGGGEGAGSRGQPSETNRAQDFDRYNHFPRSLEEEMVQKMAPLVKSGGAAPASYQPTLHPQHSAASINAKGIL